MNGIDRADRIGCIPERHQLWLARQRPLKVVQLQGAVLHVEVDPGDLAAAVLRRQQPRGDVGIVVQPGDDDLIAGVERPREGAGQAQRERGHVGAEDDLFAARGVEHVGHGLVRLVQHSIRITAGLEGAFVIRVALHQVFLNPLGGPAGDLRAAGVVEKDSRAVKRGEFCADAVAIEGHLNLLETSQGVLCILGLYSSSAFAGALLGL